ncbi:hypothetical protein [Pseudoxanthomonas wuyuanensis]
MNSTALLVIATILVFNIAASVVVLRTAVFSASQRLLQLAFIWCVPFVGAIVCAVFASSQAQGPASPGTVDPIYLPSDGGPADNPSASIGGCGDGGGDGGGCGD